MQRNFYLNSFLVLFIALFITGCSDNSTDMTTGDPNDAAYIAAREDADSTLSELTQDEGEDAGWLDFTIARIADNDTLGYDSTTGWHFLVYDDTIFFYLQLEVTDSARFTDLGDAYQQFPDSTTNQFERRMMKTFTLAIEDTSWTKYRHRNMHWIGLADSVTTVNGDFLRHWQGDRGVHHFDRVVDGEFQDVQFYTNDLRDGLPTHPFDGTMISSVTLDIEAPNGTVHLEGSLTVTFFFDHYHAYLVRGSNYWEWDHYYEQ